MEGILFIGIQASGKSTFYKERFFNSHLRISLDLLHNSKLIDRHTATHRHTLTGGRPFKNPSTSSGSSVTNSIS